MSIYNPGNNFILTSQAGERTDPLTGEVATHRGNDWAAPSGAEIPAAAGGKVVFSGWMKGYGNTLVVRHEIDGEAYYSLYAHMQEPSPLKNGNWVLPAEKTGLVGNTGGRSTGPHLHFEILAGPKLNLQKGHPFVPPSEFDFGDPNDYFRRPEFNREFRQISPTTSITFLSSRTVAPAPIRRDPLILDLDGDGLETVGINTAAPILFDHNGDGVRTATGWVKGDDAFLVLDHNGNGAIDSGRELFGDATPLVAGGTAADGFAALAQEDTNGDGLVNASDSRFASLRLWRDLNQDGLAQAGELVTLASQNIAALKVGRTANSTLLANGNQIADLGGYILADGSSGALGEVTMTLNRINKTKLTILVMKNDTQAAAENEASYLNVFERA